VTVDLDDLGDSNYPRRNEFVLKWRAWMRGMGRDPDAEWRNQCRIFANRDDLQGMAESTVAVAVMEYCFGLWDGTSGS
jgi:hypothetical protein